MEREWVHDVGRKVWMLLRTCRGCRVYFPSVVCYFIAAMGVALRCYAFSVLGPVLSNHVAVWSVPFSFFSHSLTFRILYFCALGSSFVQLFLTSLFN